MFALFAPYGLLVLIPVNLHDHSSADEQHESSINTFNRLSMSNIQHYDSRMWLHALGIYLLSALAMYFLVVEYRQGQEGEEKHRLFLKLGSKRTGN